MKLSLCNEMFLNVGWSLEKQIDFIAECGYNGVEIAPFAIDPEIMANPDCPEMNLDRITAAQRRNMVKMADAAGVELAGLHWLLSRTKNYHITSFTQEVRDRTADYLIRLVELSADFGGTYMVLGSPGQRNYPSGFTRNEAAGNAARVIEKVLPVLEKHNIILALESLAPKETNFWQTAAETLGFIKMMGSPKNLMLHLDCKAMSGGEKEPIPEIIRKPENSPYMKTFHANDPNLQGPGFGDLDFAPIMAALKDIGFDGWIGVEPFDYSPGVEALAKESIACLKQYLD